MGGITCGRDGREEMTGEEFIPGTTIIKPKVQLSGVNGNALLIIVRCRISLRRAGADDEIIQEFSKESFSGGYDNVLRTAMRYCDVS